ncbi:hypothetical protein BASA50_002512 [Batrachochytrium salamandrivorans]|uniref:Profilin n=1 Tax=Batrachochytrium salamandrivorans TaxID=1357716 RepID=A0ABQ8FMF6_9FUNG|nr:hypothetical protein BASA62_002748 [Batrachochytrium salamandrivorans]KAH6582334.1 hypothetical protein BASA60_001974 [Batrachochytrium salamandrivorans]KAH6600187.1 hypothetical protein BASA50_002512 [Batrachochytrium salamandrivorans]KAH6602389.1 hypothetical protein BASA61_001177 [Batrachochytrium salamandrivorans]
MNSLLQEALMGTHHISHAAIVRRKDGTIKAKSPNFILGLNDLPKIEAAFEQSRDVRNVDNGITFLDTPYRAVRADNLSIYAKNDKSGIIISKTVQHYIIATYDASMYPSVAVEAVEKLADYFRSKNK